jgi:metal-responsive CopG/Arc/MetJ family transcriptional regulator
MSKNRMFRGKPVRRLIVSVELDTIEVIDQHLRGWRTWGSGNRSEFVRQAIEEKLKRETTA